MNKSIKKWLIEIHQSIKELHTLYINNKGAILTEGDLECLLYQILCKHKCFNEYEPTKTVGWKSAKIHSQVTWFKDNGQSGYEVDLTVLNPKNLQIGQMELTEDYPNKGFFHDGEIVGIELKFIRSDNNSKIKEDALKDYIKILEKLSPDKISNIRNQRYQNVNERGIAFITIICCKTNSIFDIAKQSFDDLLKQSPCPPNVFPILFSNNPNEIYFINKLSNLL